MTVPDSTASRKSSIEMVDVLAHPLRKRIVDELRERNRSMSLEELAAAIDGHPNIEQLDADKTQVRLHHLHLPRLANEGLIEYEPDRRQITPTQRLDRLTPSFAERDAIRSDEH